MKIILGVCGSISAYKSIDLCRLFVKEGHEVQVVLTKGAEQFVVANTFSFLGAKKVWKAQDDFNVVENEKGVNHINLARWADKIIIAPLSANTLAKIASGQCDDLLTSMLLATESDKPVIFFPAMNTHMYLNKIVKRNIQTLSELDNFYVYPPTSGILACGEDGIGKLPDIEEIFHFSEVFELKKENKNVLISTGASIVPLDPVRHITNSSSGITGFFLAKEALRLGFNVKVLAGVHSTPKLDLLKGHPQFQIEKLKTTQDFLEKVSENKSWFDSYISSAALSDIHVEQSNQKLKKDKLGTSISISQAPDVLKNIIELNLGKKIIGFAAETDLSFETLSKKITGKPVDLLVGTLVNNGLASKEDPSISTQGFQTNSAYYLIMNKDKNVLFEGSLTKKELSQYIFKFIKEEDDYTSKNSTRIH